jgi:hypothetical protein
MVVHVEGVICRSLDEERQCEQPGEDDVPAVRTTATRDGQNVRGTRSAYTGRGLSADWSSSA